MRVCACVCVCVCTCARVRNRDRQTDRYTERETKEREKQKEGERQADRDIQTPKEIQTQRWGGAGLVLMYEGGVCLVSGVVECSSVYLVLVCLLSQYLCVWLGLCVCLSTVSLSLCLALPFLAGTKCGSPPVLCRSHTDTQA